MKGILHYDQIAFISGMQGCFNICTSRNATHHTNKMKDTSYDYIHRCRKAFNNKKKLTKHISMMKILNKLGTDEKYLNIIKAISTLPSCFSNVRLCVTIDGSPPGSSAPGILQARTLEWVAIFFSPKGHI